MKLKIPHRKQMLIQLKEISPLRSAGSAAVYVNTSLEEFQY